VSRRVLLVLGAAGIATGGAIAAQWYNILAQNDEDALTPVEAHAAARAGDILLIDIRRPEEWVATGVGDGATPIDMRRSDFIDEVLRQTNSDRSRPIALICARGVRSRRMTNLLSEAGFTTIIDVPEGMLGSGAGPGWLERGLPVVAGK
jgi:rhodanese-related sulfurtransferase